jgi:hypothetical protein
MEIDPVSDSILTLALSSISETWTSLWKFQYLVSGLYSDIQVSSSAFFVPKGKFSTGVAERFFLQNVIFWYHFSTHFLHVQAQYFYSCSVLLLPSQ